MYMSEHAADGTVWLLPNHTDVYHVFNCLPVQGARNAGITIEEVDVDGPESLAGRLLCHACARRLGQAGWNPATGSAQIV